MSSEMTWTWTEYLVDQWPELLDPRYLRTLGRRTRRKKERLARIGFSRLQRTTAEPTSVAAA